MKSRKVLDIREGGIHIICLMTDYKVNPYRVYRVDFGHRRQIAKYGDFISVMWFVRDIYAYGADVLPMPQLIDWAKQRGAL